MANIKYNDDEVNQFLEVAKDIGIGRAIRQLGYPQSWDTAHRWVKARGIEVNVDTLKAKSKEYHDWYETEEVLLVAQMGISRVYDELMESDLTADEHKKLSEAYQKYVNSWLLVKGKATNINEQRLADSTDVELLEMLAIERARNQSIESEVTD